MSESVSVKREVFEIRFGSVNTSRPIAGNRWQARLSPERLAPTTGIVVEASGEVALAAE